MTKNTVFGYFWARIFKKIISYLKSTPSNCKIFEEKKMPEFGKKNALFGYFDQQCLIWGFLGKIFRKTTVLFEISTLKFVYLQNFTKKQKFLNLGPKMSDLGILGLEFENNTVIFEISTLEFF